MTDTYSIEDLEAHGVEPLPEIIWDVNAELRVGMDYREGVTYFTVPSRINVTKTTGKGKATSTKIVQEDALIAITSDRREFTYNEENVAKIGYGFPQHTLIDRARRWSNPHEYVIHEDTPPDPLNVYQGIRNIYEQYIEFKDEAYYDMMTLFVMGSYMFRLYDSLGYVHFNGTAASGKSQNLRILSALGFNTVWASSMSAAALYRTIAGMPGIVAIDEAEGWEGERGEELRRILNAGYLEGQSVRRAEKGKNDQFYVASFPTFGPKAIASINPLDDVIGSRCIIVEMRPAIRSIPEFRQEDERWQRIRDRLYLFAMYHTAALAELVEAWNIEGGVRNQRAPALIGRQWQITQLYITLADYIDSFDNGNRCDTLITFFNEYFRKQQEQQATTNRQFIVLKALPRVLASFTPVDEHFYHLKDIHSTVSDYLEEDQKEYYKTRRLSKDLDVLGFKTKRSRSKGIQIWLTAEAVRTELKQRRVEPHDEDKAWLLGEVEYENAGRWDPDREEEDADITDV